MNDTLNGRCTNHTVTLQQRTKSKAEVNPEQLMLLRIMDQKPDVVAKQMTILDWKMFAKIKPQELLRNAWHGEDRMVTAPNLSRLTERFDQVISLMGSLWLPFLRFTCLFALFVLYLYLC